jgi:hypothetical protein
MGNTFSTSWVPRTPENPNGIPRVHGWSRPKNSYNPLNHGFWIDESLTSHPVWGNTREVAGRQRKLSRKEKEEKKRKEAYDKGWDAHKEEVERKKAEEEEKTKMEDEEKGKGKDDEEATEEGA